VASPIYAEEAVEVKKQEKRGLLGLGYGGYYSGVGGYSGLGGYKGYGGKTRRLENLFIVSPLPAPTARLAVKLTLLNFTLSPPPLAPTLAHSLSLSLSLF
jgi:hypothetical protein